MLFSSRKTQNLTVKYACIQSIYWMCFAAVMGFTSIYLLDAGFSNTLIGWIIAAAGLISAVLQPAVAGFADKPGSPSLKKIICALTCLTFGIGVLLIFSKSSLLLTGLFYGGCITLLQLLTPLINALGMESINQGKNLNFGISRGLGSGAYAIAAYILGILVANAGAVCVPVTITAGFAILFMILLPFPFLKAQGHVTKTEDNSQSPASFFKHYKRFGIVLTGCVLLYIGHVLLNSFTFQIVESKGGSSAEMGFSMAMAAILELPVMFFFGYMLKKVRCDIWFRLSGIFFTLKILGTLLVPDIMGFYLVQFFQMGGWALITVSSVYYVNSVMKKEDAIKGQAYMTMTYTLGSVLGALLGGAMIDSIGVNAMLGFGCAASFVGMIILLFAAERTQAV